MKMKKKYRRGDRICTMKHLLVEYSGQGRVLYSGKCWYAGIVIRLFIKVISVGMIYESRLVKRRGKK